MKTKHLLYMLLVAVLPLKAMAYVSDSSGSDGAFNPSADTQLTLPPSGIFNFTDVNIPAGVTVTFAKNAANTGVVLLASGNVTIDGTININGANGAPSGSEANGRGPAGGQGGPGGFAGGRGGLLSLSGKDLGEKGYGPGAGSGGGNSTSSTTHYAQHGGSAGHATLAPNNGMGLYNRGGTYGSQYIRVLVGGSGGGGGRGISLSAPGGGGGGGAIVIASSGTVTINGTITAIGGNPGTPTSSRYGGAGSGGVVRIVATTIAGNGVIQAYGGNNYQSERAGTGYIRLESDNFDRTATTNPGNSSGLPQPILYTNAPSLRIKTVAGIAVPSNPTGYRDLNIPGVTTNPVNVTFETNNIPLGTTIKLIADGEHTRDISVDSTAITGSEALGTASADIDLSEANVRLYGRVIYTITLADNAQAADYSKYAQGEKVDKLRIAVNTEGASETTLITASGKEYTWPSNAVALN